MTVERLETAVVLIRGGGNTSFGTAFAIHKDATGTYIVTCAHVLDGLEVGEIKIRDYPATIVARGRKEDFDIAVLHVADQLECPILTSCVADLESGSSFLTGGFYALGDQKVAESFEGTLVKAIRVESSDRGSVLGWYISLSPGVSLQRGSSGAPLMHRDTGLVIGIITHRLDDSRGVALSLEALGRIWTAAPPGLLDTIEGHGKRRLLLELLQGLPDTVTHAPGFESLIQVRSNLVTKSVSGHAAFDAVTSIIKGVAATLSERIKYTEDHILSLRNNLEENKKPIRRLEARMDAFYPRLDRLTLDIRKKVKVEVKSAFDILAESVRRRCGKFLDENRPPLFKRNSYLLDLEEAVNSELMGGLEEWKHSVFPKITAEVEKDLAEIFAEFETSIDNAPSLAQSRPEFVAENIRGVPLEVHLVVGTQVGGLVAMHLLQFVMSSKDWLARASDLMAEQVIEMGLNVADNINQMFFEEIRNVYKWGEHVCEQRRQEVMVGIAMIEKQINLNEEANAKTELWLSRVVNIRQQMEGRELGSAAG